MVRSHYFFVLIAWREVVESVYFSAGIIIILINI